MLKKNTLSLDSWSETLLQKSGVLAIAPGGRRTASQGRTGFDYLCWKWWRGDTRSRLLKLGLSHRSCIAHSPCASAANRAPGLTTLAGEQRIPSVAVLIASTKCAPEGLVQIKDLEGFFLYSVSFLNPLKQMEVFSVILSALF